MTAQVEERSTSERPIVDALVGTVVGTVLDPATSQVASWGGEIVGDTFPAYDGTGDGDYCWSGMGAFTVGGTLVLRDHNTSTTHHVGPQEIMAALVRIAEGFGEFTPDQSASGQTTAFALAAVAAIRAEEAALSCRPDSDARRYLSRTADALYAAATDMEDAMTADEVFQMAALGAVIYG